MQNNQTILMGVIMALVLVIGMLMYDRHRDHETLGEKVGHSIDRAADELNDAANGKR